SPRASGTAVGVVNDAPPLVEVVSSSCSLLSPCLPSDQVITIWLVASVPVGAPLAMSTLGPNARSLRAPATPSITGRPMTGSTTPGLTAVATSVGPVKWAPPSVDLYIIWNDVPPRRPTPNAYTLPWLSVRTVQPSGWPLMPLSVAGPTCFRTQVLPPSVDRATISGVGNAVPFSCPRKSAQQT